MTYLHGPCMVRCTTDNDGGKPRNDHTGDIQTAGHYGTLADDRGYGKSHLRAGVKYRIT